MQSQNMTSEGRLQKYLQSIDTDWYRNRFIVLVVAVVAAFTLLAGKLVYLQIYKGPHFYELSKDNSIRKKRSKAFRGLIYDRDGRLLVENRPAFNLQMVRRDAEPLEEIVARLASYLQLTEQEILEKLRAHKGGPYDPVLIQEDIDRNTMAAIAANGFRLPGVSIEARARRHYIYPTLAPHLLGYMGEVSAEEIRKNKYPDKANDDYVGRFGVEKAFEHQLSGKAGGRVVQVNAAGQVVSVLDEVPPQPGNHLFLTIDFSLQKTAEALLGDKTGAVVAMDPNTGDILAMVSKPYFNPNQFVDGMSKKQWQALIGNPDQPMMNKAIQAEYPPASTYKIITALAALEEDQVSLSEGINCPGYLRYGNRLYYCWKRWGHGKMDVVDAVAQSCDVFFYQMGKRLGVDALAEYAKACGLGEPTGIVLDREADGLVPTAKWKQRRIGEPWQGGETLSMAIGQSFNLVTPLQMAVLTSAVANGGTRFQPRVLKSIETVEGKTVKKGRPVIRGRLPVSENTLKTVKKGLLQAVNARHGTGYWHVRDERVEISGKTGTAQIVSRKRGEARTKDEDIADRYKPHAWFVGYAPSADPQIAVAVLVEHGEHGSSGAGPVAGELMKSYLGIREPSKKEESAQNER